MNQKVVGSNPQLERQNSLNGSQFPQVSSGAPDEVLARLPEFFRLFLSDGLLPDLVYVLELKTV